MTYRVLDLFCGAGGSAMGLHRAWPDAEIVGVDIVEQPHYPFKFIKADAMLFPLRGPLWESCNCCDEFYCHVHQRHAWECECPEIEEWTIDPYAKNSWDFIWASPPCQAYSRTKTLAAKDYPKLIDGIRSRLRHYKIPYVIENVLGAPLRNPTLLCGTMFGLKTYRHRLFETSFKMPLVMHPGHGLRQDPMRGPSSNRKAPMVVVAGHYSYHGEKELRQQAMGIDWMDRDELNEAIPPAYSEYIARQIRAFVPECRP